MHLSYQLSVLSILALAAVGCSANRSAADQHFDALKSEIAKIQAEQDRISERLEGLEAKNSQKPRDEKADPGAERPALKVVVLQPDGDPSDSGDADDAETDDAPRTTVRAYGADDGKGGKKAKKDNGKPEADAEREYQDALGLIKKKQHRRALDVLTAFLIHYPANPRSEAAMFWMAESYGALGEVDKSVEHYEAVVARFPQGSKAPDALLKLAQMHKKRGADDKAKELLNRLRSDFPQSDAARRAPKE